MTKKDSPYFILFILVVAAIVLPNIFWIKKVESLKRHEIEVSERAQKLLSESDSLATLYELKQTIVQRQLDSIHRKNMILISQVKDYRNKLSSKPIRNKTELELAIQEFLTMVRE